MLDQAKWFGRWRALDDAVFIALTPNEVWCTIGAVPRDIDRPSDHGQFSYAE
jgi:hypothetical protein